MPSNYDHDYMAELDEILAARRALRNTGKQGTGTWGGRRKRRTVQAHERALGQLSPEDARLQAVLLRQSGGRKIRDALATINTAALPPHQSWPPHTTTKPPDMRPEDDRNPWRDLIRSDLEDADLL